MFQWDTTIVDNTLNSVTLSVTDSSSQIETYTYDFEWPATAAAREAAAGVGAGGGIMTWPSSYSPDTVGLNATEWQSDGVSVNADSGALDSDDPLPSYNPNIPALALTYDSQAANPKPIIIVENPLSASGSVPSQVSADADVQ